MDAPHTATLAPRPGAPRRPMVLLALSLMAGMLGGRSLPLPPWWGWSAALTLVLIGGAGLWSSRRIHGPQWRATWLPFVALALLGHGLASRVVLAEQAAALSLAAVPGLDEGLQAQAEGTLAEIPVLRAAGWELLLAEPRVTLSDGRTVDLAGQRLRVALRAPWASGYGTANTAEPPPPPTLTIDAATLPLPGQRVRASGLLYPLRAARNPSTFDAVGYDRSQGVAARLVVRETTAVSWETYDACLRRNPWLTPLLALHENLRAVRLWMGRALDEAYGPNTAPLLRALLLGEAELLLDADREAFRATGLSHLIAVSGFNTALMLLLILGLARAGGAGPRTAAWVGIVGVLLYAALTGFKPPVARAAWMGTFILAGLGLGRRGCGLAGLATATLTSLLIDPRNLQRVDWQLSYICVLALLLLVPPLSEPLRPRRVAPLPGQPSEPPPWWRRALFTWVALPLATTIGVQLALFPVQLYYFRQANLLLPATNIAGIFLTSVGMVCGVATLALGWLPAGLALLAWPFTIVGGAALDSFSEGMHRVHEWRWTQVTMPAWPLLFMAAYYGLLLGGRWLRRESRVLAPAATGAAARPHLLLHVGGPLLLIAWLPVLQGTGSRWLDLYLLDVGQGDALVLRLPNGRVLGIDAGRGLPSDKGRFVVAPFLEALGIGQLDWFVATHADADHIGGAASLLGRVPARVLVEGPDVAGSQAFARLHQAAAECGAQRLAARAGTQLPATGAAAVRLLGPVPGMQDNDASVVLLVTLGAVDLLLTGDLEQPGEDWLLAHGAVPDIDVLKVAHHGSRGSTSAAFLAAARPELALISVGRNTYGHPTPQVLQRLSEAHARTWRTDEGGTLWLRTDGQRIELRRYQGQ